MIMENMYCQSCGMPLTKEEEVATNKDGSLMHDYCIYCYKGGSFHFGYQYGGDDRC